MRLQLIICLKKELFSSLLYIKLVLICNKCYQCKLVCTGTMNEWCKTGASPALRDRGGKIKIRGAKVFAPNFSGRNHKFSDQKQVISKKKMSSPKSEGFFWPKSQIFRPKPGDLQKKKRPSPYSEGFFWPKSQILTFFPPKNSNFFLQKKYRGEQEKNRGAKTKIGGALPPRWRRAWCKILTMKTLTEVNRT